MSETRTRPSPSDEQLASRAQAGCEASFEELVRRHQVPVLHFLRQRGGQSDAEDLTQETFLRAYVNLHRYRCRWRFTTWLFTIARRVQINHHRRTRPAAGGEAIGTAVCGAPGPQQRAADEDDRRYLWGRAAEVLSEEETTALWLFYAEDMPAPEIARVLQRSWVSVKTMMFRARKKLLPLVRDLAPEGTPRGELVEKSKLDHLMAAEAARPRSLPLS